ncbi:nitrate/nitrite transporter NrtS [Sulfobacillus thermosulfidooxidans]|nr:nitrate/nitrite transporter NrtS [Sulfobacillus thermosulfidooxidans]
MMKTEKEEPHLVCHTCGRPIVRYRTVKDSQVVWLCGRDAALYRPWVRNGVKTALVVGTILALINHGSTYWTGPWTTELFVKTGLTYCVPYAVSMWGALSASRVHHA